MQGELHSWPHQLCTPRAFLMVLCKVALQHSRASTFLGHFNSRGVQVAAVCQWWSLSDLGDTVDV